MDPLPSVSAVRKSLGSRAAPFFPWLCPPQCIQNCKKINISVPSGNKPLNLLHITSPGVEGRPKKKFFFQLISMCFKSESIGARSKQMIWLWKLLISPSKESHLAVTEQLARSSKGLLQRDPPGFLRGPECSGCSLGPFLKDKIITECLVRRSGKLCFLQLL